MQKFSCAPLSILSSALKNRELIVTLAKRDILGRYRGSVLGIGWSLINPLIMLALYTFVFGTIFKSRWGIQTGAAETPFAIALFAGLLLFNFLAECVNRAPTLVTSNPNYVKKIIFPLEILPWVAILSALFHAVLSLLILCVAQLVWRHSIPWTIVLVPSVLIPLAGISLGLGWFLSALGVYLRDIGQITGMITTVLLFLSAVFFPVSALPERFVSYAFLNPLIFIIESGRALMVDGTIPDARALLAVNLFGVVVAYLGFAWFQKTRKGFADVT